MTSIINNVMVLDFNNLCNTNLPRNFPNYSLTPESFAGKEGSRVLFGDSQGHNELHLVLGLIKDFSIVDNKLYGNIVVYDVNGFDVELASFLKDSLDTSAFIIRPLIMVLKKDDKLKMITEADVESFIIVFTREYNV